MSMCSASDTFAAPFAVTGVVLAGGRSSRMGRDKAFITIDGTTSVARQAALLRALGCDDIIISGRPGIEYGIAEARVVTDPKPDAGPLGGLVAAFSAARNPWILVVAVDLPHLSADYLRTLLMTGAGRSGIVPHGPHGYEPLIALYPRTLLPGFEAALRQNQLGLQRLIQAAVDQMILLKIEVNPAEVSAFKNWNTPPDLDSTPAPR